MASTQLPAGEDTIPDIIRRNLPLPPPVADAGKVARDNLIVPSNRIGGRTAYVGPGNELDLEALMGPFDLAQRVIDAPEGLLGIGLQKAASIIPGAGRGREEEAVTTAVTEQLGTLPEWARNPATAAFLYAAGASEAKRVAQRRAAESGQIPSIETPIGRFDALQVAEAGLPTGGLAEVGVRSVPKIAGKVLRPPVPAFASSGAREEAAQAANAARQAARGDVPGFAQTAEQRIISKSAGDAAKVFESADNNIAAAVTMFPKPIKDVVRHALRGEGDVGFLNSDEFAKSIDDALSVAKIPLTKENRLAVVDGIVQEQTVKNRTILANPKSAATVVARQANRAKTERIIEDVRATDPAKAQILDGIKDSINYTDDVEVRAVQDAITESASQPSLFGGAEQTVLTPQSGGGLPDGFGSGSGRPPVGRGAAVADFFKQGGVTAALAVPRALKATFDFSFPLIQGAVLGFSHPFIAGKNIGVALKALRSNSFARTVMDDLNFNEFAALRKKAGVEMTDWENVPLTSREEGFMTNLAEKLPFGVGKAIKGFSRSQAVFLNKMRADVFDQTVEAWGFKDSARLFPNKKPEEYKALAQFVNWATGRAGLGPIESWAPALNGMFFSPKLAISRPLTAASPLIFAAQGNTAAARVAARDITRFVGAGLGVLTLAQLGGAKVESDPTSAQFGLVQIGPHQFNIWGGAQQQARYITQFMKGERKTMDGRVFLADGSGPFGETRADIAGRFARGKAAPVPGEAMNVLTGQNIIAEKTTPMSVAAGLTIPISPGQIMDAINADKENRIRGLVAGLVGLVVPMNSIPTESEDPLFRPFGTASDLDAEKKKLAVDTRDFGLQNLEADRQREYLTTVKDAADQAANKVLASPAYKNLSPDDQKAAITSAETKARTAARRAAGIKIAQESNVASEIAFGVKTALGEGDRYEQSKAVVALRNRINPEIESLYNAQRKQPNPAKPNYDPSIAELRRGNELATAWLKSPEFVLGTKNEWDAAALAADRLQTLIADDKRRGIDPNLDDNLLSFYDTAANGNLSLYYTKAGSKKTGLISDARKAIQQDKLWPMFESGVKNAERPKN